MLDEIQVHSYFSGGGSPSCGVDLTYYKGEDPEYGGLYGRID